MVHLFQFEPSFLFSVLLRLLLACILGGMIGYEREFSSHKPAGLRTHILVSLGASLVMMTSEFAISAFPGLNVDPTRIGAQVVSGIGFLGAGAIIRHGFAIKGLTTAASLWAVACVGLACGIGFFVGAIVATFLVWGVLLHLKNMESKHQSKGAFVELSIEAETFSVIIGDISRIVTEEGATVSDLHLVMEDFGSKQLIKCALRLSPDKIAAGAGPIISRVQNLPGVTRVYS